ncbi:hypothetical protein Vadar_023545 [Vaccinium darrowii]|uniref:Uncharacterized protein n=1 Tax=Vaccinium darrowii TaxID=229202 RepID=A0ACB7XC02_9ERIC|nr:hypothetical protein Vadar_023545 [Vaccinium darrowii]
MRPPNANAAAPPIPVGRLLFRLCFGYGSVDVALGLSPLGRRLFGNSVTFLSTTRLLLRHRRIGYKKVDGAPLELRLRREYQYPADHAFRAGLAQDVVRVVFQDLTGRDRAGYFFYIAVYVYYSDHV